MTVLTRYKWTAGYVTTSVILILAVGQWLS
jgi:hypothetical protein